MGLTPEEFWTMGLIDFLDVADAQYRAEEELWDREYQRTAWQTALLMNATGNFGKKQIKPEQLYKSPFAEQQNNTGSTKKKVDKQYVAQEQDKLKDLFGLV